MKKFHPFFTIGTVGFIVVACLHMVLAFLSISSINATFFTIYPVFLTFLIIGLVFTIKNQKTVAVNK